jgi:uncharacterized membrane protein (DUF106 family)
MQCPHCFSLVPIDRKDRQLIVNEIHTAETQKKKRDRERETTREQVKSIQQKKEEKAGMEKAMMTVALELLFFSQLHVPCLRAIAEEAP